MIYSFNSRVRYSEVGEDNHITLHSILNYFQDCSTFHSEDIHFGVGTLKEMNAAWLLTSWQIVVNRYPKFGEQITVSTWAYSFKRFLGNRNFTIKDRSGNILAYANSLWIYMNTKTQKPANIPEDMLNAYGLSEKLDMDYSSRKIMFPKEYQTMDAFTIHPQHLDTNHHVNNGQYIQMALAYVPSDFTIGEMRAEYRNQAHLGDIVIPKISASDNSITISLSSEADDSFSVVQFYQK